MTSGLLTGLLSREQLAGEFGCSVRTIVRWEKLGLPVVRLGARRWHDPQSVRDWLVSRERRQTRPTRSPSSGNIPI